jgi:hypothetical protein
VSGLELQRFVEDGFLVAGSRDPHRALAAAIEDDSIDAFVEEIDWAQRNPIEPDDPEPGHVRELGDWCHRMISEAKPGWWRWADLDEEEQDDDAMRFLDRAEPGSAGAFEAVVFP